MADLWKAAEAAGGERFAAILERVRYDSAANAMNVEALLSQCHMFSNFTKDQEVEAFVAQVESVLVKRCRFVQPESTLSAHEALLRKTARRPTQLPRMRLFTTNYDLCFEVAASRARFVAIDGFSHTSPQEFDGLNYSYDIVRRGTGRDTPDYVSNVFHLYKLHGSVDWEHSGAGQVVRSAEPSKPLLIYPRSSKFESSYDQPFLEMMSRFQLALREPNCALIVIGFGFGDRHIEQPILSALRSNVSMRAIVVDPIVKSAPRPAHVEMVRLIDGGDSRVTLVAGNFEDFVQELPDLVAITDEERHRSRFGSHP